MTTREFDLERNAEARAIITDDMAVTIASWYQTPGGIGRAFAELASTGSVDLDDLRVAMGNETTNRPDDDDVVSHMFALWHWADRH
jgi:hypothetical protein